MGALSLLDDAAGILGRSGRRGFGRVKQVATDNKTVGGALDFRSEAEQLLQNRQITTAEFNRTQLDPTHQPLRFWQTPGTETYSGTVREQTPELVRGIQQNTPEHIPAHLRASGLEGISDPQHAVLKNPDEAFAEFGKVMAVRKDKARFYAAKEAQLAKDFESWKKTGEPKLLRKNGRPASDQKGSYEAAIDAARRQSNDWNTFSPEKFLDEWIGDMAKPGYGAAEDLPGGSISGQGPLKGKQDEIVEQHHGIGNQEGADMMKQTAFINQVFKLNAWQYIAQQYKVGLGKTRGNMWNLPASIHRGEKVGLHAWLTEMGFNDYWKTLLEKNPDMTQQEIMNAIDSYFEEVFYPSLIQAENLIKAAPKKHKWKGMHLPKEVLKDAKVRLRELKNEAEFQFQHVYEGVLRGEDWAMARRGELDRVPGYTTANNVLNYSDSLSHIQSGF